MKINKRLTIFSWSLYDFANTIFAMNVTSFYFPLWVKETKGAGHIYILPFFISMLLVAIATPVMGVISDLYRRRIPFLVFFTLVCIFFTALIGTAGSLVMALIFYGLANFCYQSSMVFYNSLLPEISDKDEIGKVSGYGVSLGYLGTIVGLLMVWPFLKMSGGNYRAVFIPSAVLFFIFSLPCFFLVKDKSPLSFRKFRPKIGEVFQKLKATLTSTREHPGLIPFLIAIFISLNAINTIILSMAIYSREVIQFSKSELMVFFIISTIFAMVGSLVAGFLTDRWGPKKTLSFVLAAWIGTVLLAAASFSKAVFWMVGPLAGWCLGATWVAARPMVVNLAGQKKVGEFFGLAGFVGKSSAIFGPLLWWLIVESLKFMGPARYRVATAFLAVLIGVGLKILQKVPES